MAKASPSFTSVPLTTPLAIARAITNSTRRKSPGSKYRMTCLDTRTPHKISGVGSDSVGSLETCTSHQCSRHLTRRSTGPQKRHDMIIFSSTWMNLIQGKDQKFKQNLKSCFRVIKTQIGNICLHIRVTKSSR